MEKETSEKEGVLQRQMLFGSAKRVVVKVGSAILAGKGGLNHVMIKKIADEIAFLHNSNREIILVSSGAVAAGRRKLGVDDSQALSIKEKQAFAAIGQSLLMHDYDEVFAAAGKTIAQVLLTHSDLADRKRYLNVRNTLNTLFKLGVIPIINENDTVSTKELRFSDNDHLGALITNLIEADMFLCLTDVDALYDSHPQQNPDASPLHTVVEVTDEIEAMAAHSGSMLGTGGMRAKIDAAKMVANGGGSSLIGPGKQEKILQRLFAGEVVGTFFLPQKEKMQSRKRWIAYVLKPKGKIGLDQGACEAICKRGKSLLPSGIVKVNGDFDVGDAVECLDPSGKVIAVGLTNYNARKTAQIKGLRSPQIIQIFGRVESEEVLHRDNLVIL